MVWSASGPRTLSNGYVLVEGACDPPYEEAVVNVAREDEVNGVVSTVMFLPSAPEVVVMIGED